MTTFKSLKSWVSIPTNSDFSIHNLPYGVFSTSNGSKRVGVAIGTEILDLNECQKLGLLNISELKKGIFDNDKLNNFMALAPTVWSRTRSIIQEILTAGHEAENHRDKILVPQSSAQMHMPFEVGDYTDFYSSIEHATNVGKMFRDPENALLPNWKHLPVGYHGRSSSIIIDGTPIHRPKGQQLPKGESQPIFGPCRLMDFELEMAFVVGKNTEIGESISTKQAEDAIFGMVLFNDWSARDIQKWEYVPLGPFLGKSFASTLSPWVVTMEALKPFKVKGPKQEPSVLEYLKYEGDHNYDINLLVGIQPKDGEESIICQSNYKYMYWNMVQQLAHHTINGCNVRTGDLMASGTISGKTEDSFGSMLELSWAGSKEVQLKNNETRKFIKDYDTVTIRGFAEKDGVRVGFGQASGQVLPAKD